MAGGNSHQRAVARAAKAHLEKQVTAKVLEKMVRLNMTTQQLAASGPKEKNMANRMLDFIEHPLVLGALFLVGGIVGALIFTPVFVLCGISVLLGFHRSAVVSRKSLKIQVPIYTALSLMIAGCGYFLTQTIQKELAKAQVSFADLVASKVAVLFGKKNLSGGDGNVGIKAGQEATPRISNAQKEKISELEKLIIGRNEMELRTMFGFPLMMEANIKMNIALVRHLKEGGTEPVDLRQFTIGTEFLATHLSHYGGAMASDDPLNGKRVHALRLPSQYSSAKQQLFAFENSPELPTSITTAIKNFDDVVGKNANQLLEVLDETIGKDPNYYLRYDDVSSPDYFHKIDGIWFERFIQLKPEADKITNAIRQFLYIK